MDERSTATSHVNPPQQARSRRTLERIVRAALELLDEEGPDGVTVQAVVARAKSSVGSFYARFKGKEELLEYLEERVWDEARTRWQEQLSERDWASLSLEDVSRGAARLLADAHRSRAIFLKSLDRMGAGGGEGYASFRRFVLQTLAELLLKHRSRIRAQDPEAAVRLALAGLSGIVETGDPSTGEPFAPDVTIREGSRLVLAYLTGDAGTPSAHAAVDVAPGRARESATPGSAREDGRRGPAGGSGMGDAAPAEREAATPDEQVATPQPDTAMPEDQVATPERTVETPESQVATPGREAAAPEPTAESAEADIAASETTEAGGPTGSEAGGAEDSEEVDEDEDEDVDFFDVWG